MMNGIDEAVWDMGYGGVRVEASSWAIFGEYPEHFQVPHST